jgi:DNA-binding transcriptional regulator LsrR (DeoR family)
MSRVGRRSSTASDVPLDEMMQMAVVARRHYLEGRTRVEIAEELGISRFKVSRVLDAALRSGVVRIEIDVPESVDADLSMRLRSAYDLERAVVVSPGDPRPETVRDVLGKAAARLLMDTATGRDVLGVTSGRTIDAMTRHLVALPPCEVVQLTGMSGDLNENSVDVVRRVNGVARGRVSAIYAPMTVATAAAAVALKTDPGIASAFDRFASVTMAYVAVGSWRPPDSRYYDGLSVTDREQMVALGVSADFGGSLVDAAGRPVGAMDDRVIGISLEQLRVIPSVVLVGGGPRKAGAIRSVLLSGAVTSVVTDTTVAQALLR